MRCRWLTSRSLKSRRYLRRVWRVPVDRGPAEYAAALLKKMLRKHGWPSEILWIEVGGFQIGWDRHPEPVPADMQEAIDIACRILARTYQIDISQQSGEVWFNRAYWVSKDRRFREVEE